MNKEQINLMIESLEELNEELSIQSKGTLFSEQWELLKYLKEQLILSGVSHCTCKIPEPEGKCSENGISYYCGKCAKEY
tara:strand:+ start:321 stop:557 length:237 start_codon:yes stop_codon:yes gene_type:complete